MTRRKTQQEFIDQMRLKNPGFIVVGEYVNNKTPVRIKCSACGYEWSPWPNNMLRGERCPSCTNIKRRSKEEFVSELAITNPGIVLIGSFSNVSTKAQFKCEKCGHEWMTLPSTLLRGHGCPICSRKLMGTEMKSNEQFLRELSEINGFVEPLEEYKGNRTKIQCVCHICGCIWQTTPHALLSGNGCPDCCKTGTSFYEQFIFLAFAKALGKENVLHRDKDTIGCELDIVVPSRQLAIEPGSWYWHKNRTDKDEDKERKCHEYGIELITIYDNCDSVSFEETECHWRYKCDLSSIKNREVLINLTKKLLEYAGCKENLCHEDWGSIAQESYRRSRKRTTEQFAHDLEAVNPNIEVIGDYLRSHAPVSVRCKICGHLWDSTPHDLLAGYGCSVCGRKSAKRKMQKPNSQFQNELIERNGTVEPLEDYKGDRVPILVRCLKCGYVWKAVPHELLAGHGCYRCGRVQAGITRGTAVVCIETGQTYTSLTKAEAATGISRKKISKAAKNGDALCGMHWEFTNRE